MQVLIQDLSRLAANAVVGASIWNKEFDVAEGTLENTVDTAIQSPFKVSDLKPGAAYYTRSKFGNLQIVLRLDANTQRAAFASPLHDKDGNPIVSKSNTYRIEQVVCNRTFEIPGTEGKTIEPGFQMLKAYAK